MKTTSQPEQQSGPTSTDSSLSLREQMILAMDLAGLSERTQNAYLGAMKAIQNHYGKSLIASAKQRSNGMFSGCAKPSASPKALSKCTSMP